MPLTSEQLRFVPMLLERMQWDRNPPSQGVGGASDFAASALRCDWCHHLRDASKPRNGHAADCVLYALAEEIPTLLASGGADVPHVQTHNATTDWTLNGSAYEVTVDAATHGFSAVYDLQVQRDTGTEYRDDGAAEAAVVQATQGVTVRVSATPDLRYAGRIIIRGVTA